MQVVTTMARYTKGLWHHTTRSQNAPLAPGEMVLKHVANITVVGKLESKWDNPYIITRGTRAGSYYIATPYGQQVDITWNAKSLRKFYP